MREFTLAAEEASAELEEMFPSRKQIAFKIAGQEIKAHPPTNSGPIFRFMMHSSDAVSAASAFRQLLPQIMDEDGAKIIDEGLRDAQISQGMLMDVISYLIEEWSARPTTSPRGSSSRRPRTGRPSTEDAPLPV